MSGPRRTAGRVHAAALAAFMQIAVAQAPSGQTTGTATTTAVTAAVNAVTSATTTAGTATSGIADAGPTAAGPTAAGGAASGIATPQEAPGVNNPQRAWQNWTLNCQGCHRPDGTGSEGTAPSLAGTVAKFLSVPGGREYLGRVPGVATSPLSNADLADLMNWMFWRFDREHLPDDFVPFTALEIGRLRLRPLRLEASQMRSALLQKADASQIAAAK